MSRPMEQALFENLKVVITGGGSGIGLATAKLLHAYGCAVACLDVEIGGIAPPLMGIVCDIRKTDEVERAIAVAAETWGGIDVVVNNAGIGAFGDVSAQTDDEWIRLLDVNVIGVARVTRAALPWLRRSERAAIVNTCSAVASIGLPGRVLYSASKGAVLAMTRAMAADFVADGIRVNCVTPGVVDTPWHRGALSEADYEARRAALARLQPNGRCVSDLEVARAIAYLASPLSSAITGTDLPVDGGMHSLRV